MSTTYHQYRVGDVGITSKTKLCAEYTYDNILVGRTAAGRGAVWCYLREVDNHTVAQCGLPQGVPSVKLETQVPTGARVIPMCPVRARVFGSRDWYRPGVRAPGVSRTHSLAK